jgi:tetratricopeptide (TPR) repeat protein
MGYMGFGLQKWIYQMKPRKPFKKGNKIAGYETQDIHNQKEFNLKETYSTNPEIIENRLKEAKKKSLINWRKQKFYGLLIVLALISVFALIYFNASYFNNSASHDHYKLMAKKDQQEKADALILLIKTGKHHLYNNEIENAITNFKLALNIDPDNSVALYNLILALSVDCENNSNNCEEAIEYYGKLKKLDKNQISEELESRMVMVEEIIKRESGSIF